MSGAYERVDAGGREVAFLRGRAAGGAASAASAAGGTAGGAAGAAPACPLVLVHGAGGAARNFFSVLRYLGAEAAAIDMPGHGRSPGPGARSIAEAAETILAAAGALFPRRAVVLAGHSLGAAQTLAAAAGAAPGQVAGYAALGAGARLTLGTRLAPLARASFEGFLEHMARAGTPKVTVDQLRETGADTVVADLEMASGHALTDDAARFEGPALVFAGGADEVAPVDLCIELWRAFPRARLVVEPGASHLVMVDRPRAAAAALAALAEEAAER